MKIQVLQTEEEFDALEVPWNRLCREGGSSIFSSFDYVRTAWKHFHKATDRLFLLVLFEGPSVKAIAPFYITRRSMRGIPYRVIRFISTWEGDRPQILSSGTEGSVLRTFITFLEQEFLDWEVLELAEQPAEGPEGKGWSSILPRSGWYWEETTGGVDYYVSLEGCWEEYLKSIDSRARANWRRQTRRISSLSGGCEVERVSDPLMIRDALARFIAIEQAGWKAEAKIGVAKDERHRAFYEELILRLSRRGQAFIYLLTNDGTDIAGAVYFVQHDVIYGRHIAYAPAFATYSPGILIHAQVLKEHIGGGHREVDLLVMREDGASQKAKAGWKTVWATGQREMAQWTGYRAHSRILPFILAKRAKLFLQGLRKTS